MVQLTHLAFPAAQGKPKGVMIEHLGLSNHIWHVSRNCLSARNMKLAALCTSICFDQCISELFVPLILGGTQHVLPSILYLPSLLQATFVVATPSTLAVAQPWPKTLEAIIVGGESCPVALIDRLHMSLPHLQGVWNSFGPTEVTDMWGFPRLLPGQIVVAGAPMPNTQVFVVDERLTLLPIGVEGNLVVAGIGLARGYVNLPEETASKFVPNRFGDGRMYLTGDCGYWRRTGEIVFTGRRDHLQKLMGIRVDTEGIRAVLIGQEEEKVIDAFVTVVSVDGIDILAAYLIPETIDIGALRRHAETQLPPHLCPAFFLPMQSFPLNTSGKVQSACSV